ncbi:MAG TPA: hypothetical protein VF520_06160 [Thermoleophilaceae bacterium]
MTEPAISLAFYDAARGVHGKVRSGLAVLFDPRGAHALEEQPSLEQVGEGWVARCGDAFEVTFEPFTPAADLGGVSARVCRVSGLARGAKVECLGTAGETHDPPAWAELDAFRSVSALFDAEHALLAVARRPRGSLGHGHELVTAHLLAGEELVAVEDARISTVYDAEGRQRSAGLELWLPGEDFPRRGSGTASAGLSLSLEGLRVNAAVFDWRMDGREGVGGYEITVRDEPAVA